MLPWMCHPTCLGDTRRKGLMSVTDTVKGRDWLVVALLSLALGLLLCWASSALGGAGEADALTDGGSVAGAGTEAGAFPGADASASGGPGAGSGAGALGAGSGASSGGSSRGDSAPSGSAGAGGDAGAVELPDLYDLSEGVAVTVNGVAVGEAAVRWVEAAYGRSAQASGAPPDALRSAAVDYLAGLELLRQEAGSRGLSVGEDDVRAELADVRASFASEADFGAYLAERGATEGLLALGLESELLGARLMAQVVPEADVKVGDLAVLERLQPERAAAIAASGDGDAAAERAAAAELAKLDAAQVADARARLRQQERTRLFLEWREALEAAADIE